ncbi:MAG: lycopene cyclase domain-containing protein [Crocinitomicaceae bacterium]|jgi:lycopene cyclase domain-containing protein|nr:lycopene cyclase domain-containing protein [Crocinitomicaceae bacterium]
MSAYGWVILCSFVGPFLLSFDQKVAFFRSWRFLFPSILLVGVAFLLWDECFTQLGVWGFTPKYLLGIYIGHLPLEEVLFFLVVPYNFIFILLVLQAYFPKRKTQAIGTVFSWLIGLSSFLFALIYLVKPSLGSTIDNFQYYTISATSVAFLLTLFTFKKSWYGDFALSFLVCLIPFFIVNGILTGSITDYPIVWYSEQHIIGWRMGTIPFEDLFYNYDLLLPLTWLFHYFRRKRA